MKFKVPFFWLPAVLWLAGCGNPNPAGSAPGAAELGLPTQAQPKLATMKLFFGIVRDQQFQPIESLEAELALTAEQIRCGMMFRTNIQETDAMFFNLRQPQQAGFWMKNCPESISVAYITADGVIREIHHLEQNDTNSVVSARRDIIFALETREGWFGRHAIGVGTVIRTENGSLAETFLGGPPTRASGTPRTDP